MQNIGEIREMLLKCSGGNIVEMLKRVLMADEKTALVRNELENFFQFKIEAFEKHMKTSSSRKSRASESRGIWARANQANSTPVNDVKLKWGANTPRGGSNPPRENEVKVKTIPFDHKSKLQILHY